MKKFTKIDWSEKRYNCKIFTLRYLLFLTTTFSTALFGSNYFVSGLTGSNGNNGSFPFPWADISYALSLAQSGDIIYVFNDAIYSGPITWRV
jgi:hypothetical protein